MKEDKNVIEIREFNNYLIITVIDINSPKLQYIGSGLMLSCFNKHDVKISEQALNLLIKNLKNTHIDPALEIIAKDKIWWASKQGIIIPPNELINIFVIPHHTICDNNIDEKIKNKLL